jgi:hypothetical protein
MGETKEAAVSYATVRTQKAQGYLIQLCKHFAHKIPAAYADNRGRIDFNMGAVELDATDAGMLKITVSAADADQVPGLEDVVERHLRRFAFKEELQMPWVRADIS